MKMNLLGTWSDRRVYTLSHVAEIDALPEEPFVMVLLLKDWNRDDIKDVVASSIRRGCVYLVGCAGARTDELHDLFDEVRETVRSPYYRSNSVIMTVGLDEVGEAVSFGVWLSVPDKHLVKEVVRSVAILNLAGESDAVLRAAASSF